MQEAVICVYIAPQLLIHNLSCSEAESGPDDGSSGGCFIRKGSKPDISIQRRMFIAE
jgi:hypothetical protein